MTNDAKQMTVDYRLSTQDFRLKPSAPHPPHPKKEDMIFINSNIVKYLQF